MKNDLKWSKCDSGAESMRLSPLRLVAWRDSYTVSAKWSPFLAGSYYMHEGKAASMKQAKRLALEHARDMVRDLGDDIATALEELLR